MVIPGPTPFRPLTYAPRQLDGVPLHQPIVMSPLIYDPIALDGLNPDGSGKPFRRLDLFPLKGIPDFYYVGLPLPELRVFEASEIVSVIERVVSTRISPASRDVHGPYAPAAVVSVVRL